MCVVHWRNFFANLMDTTELTLFVQEVSEFFLLRGETDPLHISDACQFRQYRRGKA
jgi:hypothetical protein